MRHIFVSMESRSTFYINWRSFFLGFLLGIFGVFIMLFAKSDRRDKVYSSLFGFALTMVVNFLLLKYYPGILPKF